MQTLPELNYTIDRRGIMAGITGPWDEFAGNNAGRNLLAREVIGRPLADFLSGAETQHIYLLRHDYVRKSGKKITFEYRCDAENLRREMQMEIHAEEDSILYSSQIVREVELSPPLEIDYTRKRGGEFVKKCSWCKSFEFPVTSDACRPLDKIYAHVPDVFQFTHGICPACRDSFVFISFSTTR